MEDIYLHRACTRILSGALGLSTPPTEKLIS